MNKKLSLIVFLILFLSWTSAVFASDVQEVSQVSSEGIELRTNAEGDNDSLVSENETESTGLEEIYEEPEDLEKKIKEEVKEKRNETSKHFLNTDGTITALIYQNPIHYKKNNQWEEIDTRIVDINSLGVEKEIGKEKIEKIKKEGFSHGVFKNSFQLNFSKVSKKPQRFVVGDGWISFQPIHKQAVHGQFNGNEAVYPEVWEHTDLKYTSQTIGLKEEIILNGPGHPMQFSFRFQLHNLSYKQTENGDILFSDKSGEVKAIIPPGYMIDANEESSDEVTILLEEKGNNLILTLIPDESWIQAEERVYPIVIDPTIRNKNLSIGHDAFVTNHGVNSIKRGGWDRVELGMNKYWGWKTQHTLLKFNVSGIPKYAVIKGAQAKLFMYDVDDAPSAKVKIYEPSRSWNEWDITWDNKPGVTNYYKTVYVNSINNEYKSFPVNPVWVKNWTMSPTANKGVFLYTVDEGKQSLKHFSSKERGISSQMPKLYVEYEADLIPVEPIDDKLLREINTFKIRYSDSDYQVSSLAATVMIQEINNSGSVIKNVGNYPVTISNNSFTIPNLKLKSGRYQWLVKDNFIGTWGPEGTIYIDQDPPVPPKSGWSFGDSYNISGTIDSELINSIENGSFKLRATLTWKQFEDINDIVNVSLRYRKNNGNWINPQGSSTNTSRELEVDWYSTYQIQIKGTDSVGNESIWYDLGTLTTPPKPAKLDLAQFVNPDEVVIEFEDQGLTDEYNIHWFAEENPEVDYDETGWTIESSGYGTVSYTIDNYNFTAGKKYQFSIGTKHGTQELWVSTNPIEAPNTPPTEPVLASYPKNYASLQNSSVFLSAKKAEDADGDDVVHTIKVQNVFNSKPTDYSGYAQYITLDNGEYLWWVEASDEIDTVESKKRTVYIDQVLPIEPVFTIIKPTDNPAMATTIDVTTEANIQIRLDEYKGKYPNGYPYPSDDLRLNDVEYFEILSGLPSDPVIVDKEDLNENKTIDYTLGSEGKYEIEVISYDKAGNSNSSKKSITLDHTKPPKITFSNKLHAYFSNDGDQVKFNWNAITDLPVDENSGIYKYVVSYARSGKTEQVDVLNSTSYIFQNVKPNEEIKVQVKAVDKAGNEGDYSSELTWYGLPPIAMVMDYNVSVVNPVQPPYQQQIELTISDVECDYYVVQVENISDSTEPPFESGQFSDIWTFTYNVSAKQTYKYRIITYNDYDSEHLYSYSEYEVTIENNPPTQPVMSIIGLVNGYLSQSSTTVSASSVDYDNGDDLTYVFSLKKNGNSITINDDDIIANTCLLSNLTDGDEYQVVVTASDGEESTSSEPITFTVDLSGPEISITPLPDKNYVTEQSIAIGATDSESGMASLQYKWDIDGFYEDVPEDGVIYAPNGTNQLIVKAVDNVGNISMNLSDDTSSDSMYIYRVDSKGPIVESLNIQGQIYNNQMYINSNEEVYINFEFLEDKTSISRYRYGYLVEGSTIDDLSISELPEKYIQSLSSYQGSQKITGQFLDGQTYYPVLVVYDSLGNRTEKVSSTGFCVDGSGPVISDINLTGLSSYGTDRYLTNISSVDFTAIYKDQETQAEAKFGVTDVSQGEPTAWKNSFAELRAELESSSSLIEGNTYYFVIQAENGVGLSTRAYSTGFVVDTQEPEFILLRGGRELPEGYGSYIQRDNTFLEITWEVQDLSPISSYYYKIGNSGGGSGNISQGFEEADSSGWVPIINANEEDTLVISRPNYIFADDNYYVTIKVVDAAGNEALRTSNAIQINTTLPPVPMVNTDAIYVREKNQIHFMIDMVNPEQDVVGYQYQIIDETGSTIVDWQLIETSELHDDLTHKGLYLADGVKYYIAVKAKYMDGTFTKEGWANVTIDSTAPTNLLVQTPTYASAQQLVVSWSAIEDISSIRYWAKVGTTANGDDKLPLTLIGQGKQHTFKNISASNGEVLYITVMAENSSGLSTVTISEPIIIDNTPPECPLVIDDGMYTNIGHRINVSWNWSQDDPESGIDSYQVALLTAKNVTVNTDWITVPATEKQYTFDGSFVDGTIYFVAVKAFNRAGLFSIGYTDGILVDTSRPAPPGIDDHGDFMANVDGLATLTANAYGTDPHSGIKGYYYSLGTFIDSTLLINNQLVASDNVLGGNNLDLQLNHVYFFTVVAQNNAGDISAESMSDGIMVIDGSEPKVQTIIDGGDYSIFNDRLFFIWDVNDTTVPIDHYEYWLVTDQDQVILDEQWKVTHEKRTQIYAEDILSPGSTFEDGTTYYLAVRVVNQLDQPTIKLVSDGIKIDSTPPDDPILDTDDYVSWNFKLNWSAADSHSGIVEYQYAIGTTRGANDITGGWNHINVKNLDEQEGTKYINQTILLKNLIHGERYYLAVKAQNGVGLWSNPVMSDALIADLEAPTTPEVTAGAYTTSKSKIENVSFTSDDPDSGIIGYRYEIVTSNTLTRDLTTSLQEVANFTNELSISDLDIANLELTEGQTYYVAVQTLDRMNQWSEIGYSQPIKVDTELPFLAFDTSESELVTNDGSLEVKWVTNEPGTLYYRLIFLNADGTHATNPDFAPIMINDAFIDNFTGKYKGSFTFNETMVGSYKYEMYQVDLAGNTINPITQLVRYNNPPHVELVSTSSQLYKGHGATFTLNAFDEDGTIVEYQWVVNGVADTKVVGVDENPDQIIYTFNEPGVYLVEITVKDNDHGTSYASVEIVVTNTLEGDLVKDETWSSLMEMRGNVIVPEGRTLIILSGTEITFPATCKLEVRGSIQFAGTVDEPIVFTGTRWNGIEIYPTATVTGISYLHVSEAERGLALFEQNVEVQHVTFDRNIVGLHLYQSTATVKDSIFSQNQMFGIKEDIEGNAVVIDSIFRDNRLSPYYDEDITWLSVQQLNQIAGNSGNTE